MVISQGGMVISQIGLSCGLVHVFFFRGRIQNFDSF